MPKVQARPRKQSFLTGLARAAAGSILFTLPMLMTMEMWEIGAYMSQARLALLLVLLVPLLVALSHVSGFEDTFEWREDVVDAFVACAVAAGSAIAVLWLFDVIDSTTPPREWIGIVALQTIPGSIGALLAQGQFGGDEEKEVERERTSSYWGELFVMVVGALFLSLNVAPTEEIVLIGYRLGPWHALVMVAASLAALHTFVYAVGLRDGSESDTTTWRHKLFAYTLPGYVLTLGVSATVLWAFGRLEAVSVAAAVYPVVVLAFPASIGAAAARLLF